MKEENKPKPEECPIQLLNKFLNSGGKFKKDLLEKFDGASFEGPTVDEYFNYENKRNNRRSS